MSILDLCDGVCVNLFYLHMRQFVIIEIYLFVFV